jgi:hypothetical protein
MDKREVRGAPTPSLDPALTRLFNLFLFYEFIIYFFIFMEGFYDFIYIFEV